MQSSEWQERQRRYSTYIHSAWWRVRRTDVLRRAGGQCELCHAERAKEVRHLTFENFENEPLEDLIALGANCLATYFRKKGQGRRNARTLLVQRPGPYEASGLKGKSSPKPARRKERRGIKVDGVRWKPGRVALPAPEPPPVSSASYRGTEEWAEKKESILRESGHVCAFCGGEATEVKLERGDIETAYKDEFFALCTLCFVGGRKERPVTRRRKCPREGVSCT